MVTIEVCIDSAHGARAALEGGVERLEICASLAEGGLTPSVGLVCQIDTWGLDAEQYIMIRPRGGDFMYSEDEIQIMEQDIRCFAALKLNSVKGFVFGVLTKDRKVNVEATKRLVAAAVGYETTFHRAVDVALDTEGAVRDVIACGCTCILTSGGCAKAIDGITTIKSMIEKYGRSIAIMPGSGVNPSNAPTLLTTGARHLHFSAKTYVPSAYTGIAMGSSDSGAGYNSASKDLVEKMLTVVSKL
eukprot:TRINITY_DN8995_c0_g1_i1.p1 TRINITY_DN8995_c0_g1~~TRINITY_DN8995_c0_g1_i1.p1  ORF type:complete len:267 (+),score=56.45 TRINITY_DN8995_c0_g1_i1:69-803(+)